MRCDPNAASKFPCLSAKRVPLSYCNPENQPVLNPEMHTQFCRVCFVPVIFSYFHMEREVLVHTPPNVVLPGLSFDLLPSLPLLCPNRPHNSSGKLSAIWGDLGTPRTKWGLLLSPFAGLPAGGCGPIT